MTRAGRYPVLPHDIPAPKRGHPLAVASPQRGETRENVQAEKTMGIERRRDRRYPFHLGLIVSWGRQKLVAESEDVSFNGVFVRTDTLLPERQLVRLRATLPPDGVELAATGMVARRLPASAGCTPGLAIRLYALGPEERERWDRFVRYAGALAAVAAIG